MTAAVRYSRGRDTYDNLPDQREAADFDEFAQAVLSDRSDRKGQFYICAPFNKGAHSDSVKNLGLSSWRQKALVSARAFLPFDIDRFDTPATFAALLEVLKRYKGFAYTTSSHTDAAPRCRLVLAQTRPTTRDDGLALGRAVQSMLDDLCIGRIDFDSSVYKAEQPLFTPLHGAQVFYFNGASIDVDEMLLTAPAFNAVSVPQLMQTASTDPVWQALDRLGMVKRDMGNGKYAVVCPCAADHSGGSGETSTAYYLPHTGGYRDGGFNCLHSHCKERPQDEFRKALGFAVPDREIVPFLEPNLPKCDARDGTKYTRPMTEYGNAQRLFDANGDRLRYVHDAQSWIVWDGAAWQWDAGSGVRSLAAKLPETIYSEGNGYINDAEKFGKWARKSQELRTINAAVALLSDFAPVRLPLACIDTDHFTIGVNQARQVIDLRNGATRAATPADYITKSLSAETLGNAAQAVRWLQFLEQIFNDDQELIDWMQRFCGYLLTGSTREAIFLFCFRHGANGKSVFIEVLKHIIGDYSRAIASETLSESKRQAGGATPDLAALIGARLVLCSETEDNTALAESLVKSLVSGDSMAVRQLYAAPVQFTPKFKLVMAGNHKPIVRGNDNGIWRRVRLVPFNRTFSPDERDPHLLDKLKAETPHILAWMVAGCIEWQRQGLADTPATIRQATDAYQVDQDYIGTWLSECTSSSVDAATAAGDLYASYKTWCIDNGSRPSSSSVLGRRLADRGFIVRKSHGKRLWGGLSLTDSLYADLV